MVTAKVSTTDMCGLAPLQVQERTVFEQEIFLAQVKQYTTNEPNLKIICNCIYNVFEDPAQRVHSHTIVKLLVPLM